MLRWATPQTSTLGWKPYIGSSDRDYYTRKQRLRWATPQTSTLGSYTKGNPTLVHQTRTSVVPDPDF